MLTQLTNTYLNVKQIKTGSTWLAAGMCFHAPIGPPTNRGVLLHDLK